MGPVDYHVNALLGQTLTMKDKCDYKINDKLKMSMTAVYDLQEVMTKGESSNITMGLSAELKIWAR